MFTRRQCLHFTTAALAVLIISACGGKNKQPSIVITNPTTISSSTAPSAVATTATSPQLQKFLLTLDDMPTGWAVAPATSDDDDDPSSNDLCADAEDGEKYPATINFSKGSLGPFLLQGARAYTTDKAKAAFSKLSVALRKCAQTPSTPGPDSYALSLISFPKIGDESIAVRAIGQASIVGIPQFDIVFFRRGNVVSLIAQVSIGFSSGDSSVLETLAKKADAKLQLLH